MPVLGGRGGDCCDPQSLWNKRTRLQTTVSEHPSCNGLRDGGFSRPSKTVEPEYGRIVEILDLMLDLVQYGPSSSLQTTVPTAVSISCPMGATATIQNRHFGFETYR